MNRYEKELLATIKSIDRRLQPVEKRLNMKPIEIAGLEFKRFRDLEKYIEKIRRDSLIEATLWGNNRKLIKKLFSYLPDNIKAKIKIRECLKYKGSYGFVVMFRSPLRYPLSFDPEDKIKGRRFAVCLISRGGTKEYVHFDINKCLDLFKCTLDSSLID